MRHNFAANILAPWYPNLGLDRTYVFIGTRAPFTYDAYIEAQRQNTEPKFKIDYGENL
jgi:hypothetical protein